MKRILLGMTALAAMTIAFTPAVVALEPTVVTFDNGIEGWTANPACETISADGGNPGAYLNIQNNGCDNNWFYQSRFWVRNDNDPAFIGDYTTKGPVRVSVDVNINFFDFDGFFPIAVEEFTELIVEFIDYDNPYTDPDTGISWPWTSVIYTSEYFNSRDGGWKTFNIDIADPAATEVPEGWTGFGGPEDPNTFLPQLPPGVTFAEVMAGVDEVQFHTWKPGYSYAIKFLYDIDFDNITIRELPRECEGHEATVYVDYDGIIRGGDHDGMTYNGALHGTQGNDVIVGTDGHDSITGKRGSDIICGGDGDDSINGQHDDDMIFGGNGDDTLIGQRGDDFIMGGDGRDVINGGPGSDTCLEGEVVNQCGEAEVGIGVIRTDIRRPIGDRTVLESDDTQGNVVFGDD